MFTYALTAPGVADNVQVVLRSDGAYIPPDPNNADFQAYLAWLASGGEPTKAPTPPTPDVVLTFLQFMALFTAAEQASLVTTTDVQTKLFVLMASGAGTLDLSNTEVIQGVNYIASIGIIASTRVAQILGNQAPPTS